MTDVRFATNGIEAIGLPAHSPLTGETTEMLDALGADDNNDLTTADALGNLISVQLWEQMQKDMPNMQDQIRAGQFGDLLEWLVTNIHQHGKKYEPQELVQRVTGSKLDAAPYLRYLNTKYGEIYGL
jgi:hypothetical protein